MKVSLFSFTAMVVLSVLITLTGCDDGLTRMGGKVMVDGNAVDHGVISFYPVAGGRPAEAFIKDDGSFTLSSYSQGDGLPHGEYIVCITCTNEGANAKTASEDDAEIETFVPGRVKYLVPRVYGDPKTTPLRKTIDDQTGSEIDFDLSSKEIGSQRK